MARIRRRALITALAASPLAAPKVLAQGAIRWRMATSWPKNLPGPGLAAAHVARRVHELSGGRLEIQHFAAGEIVPAFQVLDAVSNGTVEIGHTASFFAAGKAPAANVFTTIPFGPDPIEHQAWLERGGGQALWDELYRPFGVKPFLAGNTGPSMAGWFKREIGTASDVRGLKIRVQGLGGEVWARLGAVPLAIPPGDLLIALSSGTIDAAEFLAPVNDRPLGLYKPAPFYYAPGFNKPNGAAELIIHLAAWQALPGEFRAMIEAACIEAHARGLTEAQAENSEALVDLVGRQGVKLRRFSPDFLSVARKAAEDVIGEIAAKSEAGGRILASLAAHRARSSAWRRVTFAGQLALQPE